MLLGSRVLREATQPHVLITMQTMPRRPRKIKNQKILENEKAEPEAIDGVDAKDDTAPEHTWSVRESSSCGDSSGESGAREREEGFPLWLDNAIQTFAKNDEIRTLNVRTKEEKIAMLFKYVASHTLTVGKWQWSAWWWTNRGEPVHHYKRTDGLHWRDFEQPTSDLLSKCLDSFKRGFQASEPISSSASLPPQASLPRNKVVLDSFDTLYQQNVTLCIDIQKREYFVTAIAGKKKHGKHTYVMRLLFVDPTAE